jgi:hypothetical protein
MVNLELFDLHTNQLSGSLPTDLLNLPKIEWINLADNALTGILTILRNLTVRMFAGYFRKFQLIQDQSERKLFLMSGTRMEKVMTDSIPKI